MFNISLDIGLICFFVALITQFKIYEVSGFGCGTKNFDRALIIGGGQAKRGEWPFIVALYEKATSRYFCGGTLISDKHVLTAAHCIHRKYLTTKLSPDGVEVRIGAYNLTNSNEGIVQNNVSKIYIHPAWDADNDKYDADIAILVLSSNVNFTNNIRPVCMPTDDDIVDSGTIDVVGYIVGWGLTENSTYDDIPRHANVAALNDSYCYMRDYSIIPSSSSRTFCGGDGGGLPNKGDSGGGFFVLPGSVSWIQYGIVSAIATNATGHITSNSLAVYTNVKMFKEWIQETVTQSGGELGEVIETDETKISLTCNYALHTSDDSKFYTCGLQDLDIRFKNVEVAFLNGTHKLGETDDDLVGISFDTGTMFYLPGGFGKFFKNVKYVQVGSSLRTKLIKRSNFKDLESVTELSIFQNDITILHEDSLWDLPNLERFILSHNKLNVINAKTFEKNLKLERVGLQANRLKVLPANLFENNLFLQVVRLDENQLEFIPSNLFGKNLFLQVVSVTANFLITIDENTFVNNTYLAEVDMNANQLRFLPKNLFRNNVHLEIFYVGMNPLKTIDEGIFHNNINLRDIRLFENQLKLLPVNLFQKNVLLRTVSLPTNSLQTLDELVFVNNVKLLGIVLHGNELEFLPRNVFKQNLLLQKILLSYNSIRMVDEDIFLSNTELKEIHLNNNRLEFLPKNLFKNNLLLEKVQLSENDLKIIEIDFTLLNIKHINLYNNICIYAVYLANEKPKTYHRQYTNLTEFQNLITDTCSYTKQ